MSVIMTYTKKLIDPTAPEEDLIDIRDIAHALSMVCRSGGQFPSFYSVASHSIACEREAEQRGFGRDVRLACLLHDASEAYLSDITRPVKQALSEYREIEKRLQDMIYKKYLGRDISNEERAVVSEIDDLMLYTEFHEIMGEDICQKSGELLTMPSFEFVMFDETERTFLNIFHGLACFE